MLRFLDAGESHGKCLMGIIEGLPAGLSLSEENINFNLKRRQGGYGRGERMKIEQDRVEILSGLVEGKTIGSPLGLMIKNKDWENWQEKEYPPLTIPRPGHADFAGAIKYGFKDVRKSFRKSKCPADCYESSYRLGCQLPFKRIQYRNLQLCIKDWSG